MTATKTRFQIVADTDFGVWVVRKASNAFSFSEVPAEFTYEFESKSKAIEQVRRLGAWQRKGNTVKLDMIDTPGCFEAVADTKYGCAW